MAWDGKDRRREDSCVDPEVQLAIKEGDEEVIRRLTDAIRNAISEATKTILAHIDAKVTPMEKDANRFRSDLDDLYEKDRAMRDRVGVAEGRIGRLEENAVSRRWLVPVLVTVGLAVGGLIITLILTGGTTPG